MAERQRVVTKARVRAAKPNNTRTKAAQTKADVDTALAMVSLGPPERRRRNSYGGRGEVPLRIVDITRSQRPVAACAPHPPAMAMEIEVQRARFGASVGLVPVGA